MKKQTLLLPIFFMLVSISLMAQTKKALTESGISSLKRNFLSPPASTHPWVFWFWINGTVNREGITADLEAMKRVGIGGVLIMDVSFGGQPQGPVKFMSKEWQSLFQFAIQEAARLGLKIRMTNDAGWTGSGGPWIEPEDGMQTVVYSQVSVAGGRKIIKDLPQPAAKKNYYRDIAVLAVQDPPAALVQMTDANPSLIVSTYAGASIEGFPTRQRPVALSFPSPDRFYRELPSLTIHFNSPYTACNLELTTTGKLNGWFEAELQVSDDGKNFRPLKTFSLGSGSSHFDNKGKVSLTFDMVTAPWFTIKFVKAHTDDPVMNISSLDINPRYQIEHLKRKDLSFIRWDQGIQSAPLTTEAPMETVLPQKKIIDVSKYMDAKGHLSWKAPKGKWTILRFGHTFTGVNNHPATSGGVGPESNKLSKEGIRKQFEGFMEKLIALAGPHAGRTKTLTGFHIDSWEVGAQNWTDDMRDEFRKRRGYDITPFLPVLAGRIVGGQQVSERFLWDLRKTVSELMVVNYMKEMQDLCHKYDLEFSCESYTTIGNDLDAANWVDEPMGEFWTRHGADIYDNLKAMSSAAHLNSRPVVGAESFTSREDERWLSHPATIKAIGDKAFCDGINRFIIHRYAMQPWLDIRPGMSMFSSGLHYERTQTWWNYTLPWHTYVSRCQYLLRQGTFVADILNLQPEDPLYRFQRLPVTGYDYDACSPDAFQRFKWANGGLVNGAGNKYRLLVLTHTGTMTLPTLMHIRDLVLQGASILGDPPMATPGLAGYPEADDSLKNLVKEIWGDRGQQHRRLGKGNVFSNISPEEALEKTGIIRDFSSDADLHYIHRSINQIDIYFIANGTDSTVIANCNFRVDGKRPQWWDPETGERRDLTVYATANDGTISVPLILGPSGSGFVVFVPGENSDAVRIEKIEYDNKVLVQNGIVAKDVNNASRQKTITGVLQNRITSAGSYAFIKANGEKMNVNIPLAELSSMEINGPWKLEFALDRNIKKQVKLSQLTSWTQLPDMEINYFSGTGSYTKTINIPAEFLEGSQIFLDLGSVHVMAKVSVNGKQVGILWKPPYRVNITPQLHPGENNLQIEVVNLLVNRQIGDEYLPEDSGRNPDGSVKSFPDWLLRGQPSPAGRHTFTNWRLWSRGAELQPSGLLGPVTLERVKFLNTTH